MSQKSCARLLKAILLTAAVMAAVLFFVAAPFIAVGAANDYPEYHFALIPWLVFILASSVPIFIALGEAWGIFTRIGRDRSFCSENALAMRHISILAGVEGGYLLAGDIIMYFFVVSHPSIFLLIAAAAAAALMVCGLCAVLSILISKASGMQDEIDLTI